MANPSLFRRGSGASRGRRQNVWSNVGQANSADRRRERNRSCDRAATGRRRRAGRVRRHQPGSGRTRGERPRRGGALRALRRHQGRRCPQPHRRRRRGARRPRCRRQQRRHVRSPRDGRSRRRDLGQSVRGERPIDLPRLQARDSLVETRRGRLDRQHVLDGGLARRGWTDRLFGVQGRDQWIYDRAGARACGGRDPRQCDLSGLGRHQLQSAGDRFSRRGGGAGGHRPFEHSARATGERRRSGGARPLSRVRRVVVLDGADPLDQRRRLQLTTASRSKLAKEHTFMVGAISSEAARRAIDAGAQRAVEIGVPMSIAVIDAGRDLVAFLRMDGALLGSIEIAQAKAYTARTVNARTADSSYRRSAGRRVLRLRSLASATARRLRRRRSGDARRPGRRRDWRVRRLGGAGRRGRRGGRAGARERRAVQSLNSSPRNRLASRRSIRGGSICVRPLPPLPGWRYQAIFIGAPSRADDVKTWGWAPYPVNAWVDGKSTAKTYDLLDPKDVTKKWHLCVLMPTLTDANLHRHQLRLRPGSQAARPQDDHLRRRRLQQSHQADRAIRQLRGAGRDGRIPFQAISEEGLKPKVQEGKAEGIAEIAVDNMVSPEMPYDAGVFPDNYVQASASRNSDSDSFKDQKDVGILDFPGPRAANWAAAAAKGHQVHRMGPTSKSRHHLGQHDEERTAATGRGRPPHLSQRQGDRRQRRDERGRAQCDQGIGACGHSRRRRLSQHGKHDPGAIGRCHRRAAAGQRGDDGDRR